MAAIDHRARLRIDAAPPTQRFVEDHARSLGFSLPERHTPEPDAHHGVLSLITRPVTADSTQSKVEPNTTSSPRFPGA